MSGRLRLWVAAAFALLFFLIPAPDAASGRPYLATLQVRRWLLQPDGPLAGFVQQGRLAGLQVEVRLSPPDPRLAERCGHDIARAAREWAMARTSEARTAAAAVTHDPGLGPVPLLVRSGEHGAQATFHGGAGPTATFRFPDRGSLLPPFLAIVLAVLLARVIPALLLGCLAGAALTLVGDGSPRSPAPCTCSPTRSGRTCSAD
jgi:hypothetical protein